VAVQFTFSTIMCIVASMDGNGVALFCIQPAVYFTAIVVNIMTVITIYCTPLAKKVPINYILLAMFTVAETIMFCALCGFFDA
jgi:hypothetical protein